MFVLGRGLSGRGTDVIGPEAAMCSPLGVVGWQKRGSGVEIFELYAHESVICIRIRCRKTYVFHQDGTLIAAPIAMAQSGD